MANYCACARTNYFRVNDEEKYKELIKYLVSNSEIEFLEKEINGEKHFGFASYGCFDYEDTQIEEFNFDIFLDEMQKLLPDGEVFVYMESGHEKIRYVTGIAIICTNKEIRTLSMQNWILEQAMNLTGRDIFDNLNY